MNLSSKEDINYINTSNSGVFTIRKPWDVLFHICRDGKIQIFNYDATYLLNSEISCGQERFQFYYILTLSVSLDSHISLESILNWIN